MSHTKGEWRQDPTGDVGWWSIGTTEKPVAYIDFAFKSDDESKANAHLIAAAPDLLIACEQFVKDGRAHTSIIDQGITAISKAKKEG